MRGAREERKRQSAFQSENMGNMGNIGNRFSGRHLAAQWRGQSYAYLYI